MLRAKITVFLAVIFIILAAKFPQASYAQTQKPAPCLSEANCGKMLYGLDPVVKYLIKPQSPKVYVLTSYVPDNGYVSHKVVSNETLQAIAQQYYANQAYWTLIWNDNPDVSDPSKLETGSILRIRSIRPDKPGILASALQNRLNSIQQANETSYSPVVAMTQQQYPPLSSYDSIYEAAGAKFGVPWQILYGIHETETGCRNGPIFSEYGTGAQGPMQFMPGTFRAYAVDARGTGIADINDAVDAIYTAANFLAKHGSVMAGLEAYGGNTQGVLALARQRGYTP